MDVHSFYGRPVIVDRFMLTVHQLLSLLCIIYVSAQTVKFLDLVDKNRYMWNKKIVLFSFWILSLDSNTCYMQFWKLHKQSGGVKTNCVCDVAVMLFLISVSFWNLWGWSFFIVGNRKVFASVRSGDWGGWLISTMLRYAGKCFSDTAEGTCP